MAPNSGVLIDEAENLLIGLALDVFDLVANEMHCIHAWWSYAAEEGGGYTYSPDTKGCHSFADCQAGSIMVSRIYACTRSPLRCHSTRVLTVTDLRNAELKGKGARGVNRKGKGGRRGKLCANVHGRAGGYIEVGSYRESGLRWLIRPYAPC